nr:hypothetical protein [uncultured Flavobacterium sp.]
MKNHVLVIILIITSSCKDNKIFSPEKKVQKEVKKENINSYEVQQIGRLYQPANIIIKVNNIGGNTEKEDYQITLTNSNLLDSKLEDLQMHSKKIAALYNTFLTKTLKPFNVQKIIVKIEHKNGKNNSFEFTEQKFIKK